MPHTTEVSDATKAYPCETSGVPVGRFLTLRRQGLRADVAISPIRIMRQ